MEAIFSDCSCLIESYTVSDEAAQMHQIGVERTGDDTREGGGGATEHGAEARKGRPGLREDESASLGEGEGGSSL